MKCLICGREIDIQKESFECDSEGVIQHIACKELQDSKVGYDMLRDYLSQSKKIVDLEAKLAESEEELKQYKYAYENSMVLDYTSRNWLAVGSIQQENEQLKQQLADMKANQEKEINRICKTHIEANAKLKEQLAELSRKYELASLPVGGLVDTARDLEEQLVEKKKEIDDLKARIEAQDKELHYKTAECEKWKADYKNCSELEKIMQKEHQYCLDNWRASEQEKISFAIAELEKVKELAHKHIKEIANDLSEEDDERLNQKHTIHGLATTITDIDNQIKQLRGE